jgi:hypothetical protein
MPRAESAVDAFERDVGVLPMSVRAWYELVGGVNFVGIHPGWLALLKDADASVEELREREEFRQGDFGRPYHRLARLEPLFVYPLHAARAWEDMRSAETYHLPLMPDQFSLFGEQGESSERTVELPCAAADALLSPEPSETTFVNYLRTCLRWGGFPGWEQMEARPDEDIAYLTKDLIPL